MKNPFYKAKRQKDFIKPLLSSNKQFKSSDVNILLNRVKTNQKNESRRKLYFSAAASTGILLFGLIIF